MSRPPLPRIGTYDTAAEGITIRGVRRDGGDLAEHAIRARRILEAGGLDEVRIFASGSVDEHRLAHLAAVEAPIDGVGIGTHPTASAHVPYLDRAYKLREDAGLARRRRSTGKATWPGRKQVYRRLDGHRRMAGDVVTVEGGGQDGAPLVRRVMAALRARARAELARLPEPLERLDRAPDFAVEGTPTLEALAAEVDARAAGGGAQ